MTGGDAPDQIVGAHQLHNTFQLFLFFVVGNFRSRFLFFSAQVFRFDFVFTIFSKPFFAAHQRTREINNEPLYTLDDQEEEGDQRDEGVWRTKAKACEGNNERAYVEK